MFRSNIQGIKKNNSERESKYDFILDGADSLRCCYCCERVSHLFVIKRDIFPVLLFQIILDYLVISSFCCCFLILILYFVFPFRFIFVC